MTEVGERTYPWLSDAGPDDCACFPIAPFFGRIRDGRFNANGDEVTLPPNLYGEPFAIHGHAFQQSWEVGQTTDDQVDLHYLYSADDWPWSYKVEQSLKLVDRALRIQLTLTSLSDSEMPYGLGIHPYFPQTPNMSLSANVAAQWRLDAELLALGLEEVPAKFRVDLIAGINLDNKAIDQVLANWNGLATINWADRAARLELTCDWPNSNLVIYAQQGGNFVCAEPVTNTPNGFNLPGGAGGGRYDVLQPGQSVSMNVCMQPSIEGHP